MKRATGHFKFYMILLIPLLLVTAWVIILDPFFHYHKPISGMSYILSDERYQNDGIVKHFTYNAIMSGSSVTQNFKASDIDTLWNANAVKTCMAGASFREVDELIQTALESPNDVQYVFRSLDLNMINAQADTMAYDDIPGYMYDSNPLNDYKYIFNKEVLLKSMYNVLNTIQHKPSTTFDEYGSFYLQHAFGREAVLSTFTRTDMLEGDAITLTDEDKAQIEKNLKQNIIQTAQENPDVTFYYFIPPYSICFWDAVMRTNQFDYMFELQEYAFSLLLEQENIRVYSYNDCINVTADLDNYMDTLHYSDQISSWILTCMSQDVGRVTQDDYKKRLLVEKTLLESYDYDAIYEN